MAFAVVPIPPEWTIAALAAKKVAYFRPVPENFPAVDSVLVLGDADMVLLLQMTMSRRHGVGAGLGADTINAIINKCNATQTVGLVYVVPGSMFKEYRARAMEGVDLRVKQYCTSV